MDEKIELFLPVIPLRGVVVFPETTSTIDVAREKSLAALNFALDKNINILLVPQLDAKVSAPEKNDLLKIGTIAKVKQVFKTSNDSVRLTVQGISRGFIIGLTKSADGIMTACYYPVPETPIDDEEKCAMLRVAKMYLNDFARANQKATKELLISANAEDDADKFVDLVSSFAVVEDKDRKAVLSETDSKARLEFLISILAKEVNIIEIEKVIADRVRKSVDKNQKEYYLREQIKAISDELGDGVSVADEYRKKIAKLKIKDKDIIAKLEQEIDRLSKLPQSTPEYAIASTYLDWICDLPFNKYTVENKDINNAKKILDEDHYGLEKVKERILEFLSVKLLTNSLKGPVLCLVGPPGVGKTSIAKSIARALNRNYVRMSLGGVRDEAEIRGHRKTYIGAMPGRIISNIKLAKSMNPVMLLDEVNRLSSDYRGDPASALLEVLDGEINNTFRDNYLEIPFDLSQVLFICTANTVDTIPSALLDRMEVIEISGYTEDEKVKIAEQYLIPKTARANGLDKRSITFTEKAIKDVISGYTRESGVRNLERELANVYRKIALISLEKNNFSDEILIDGNVSDYLGAPKFLDDEVNTADEVGAATGLAWTSVGGTTLTIEVSLMPGKGEIILTGKLGDVMKESARAAISYIRAHAAEYGIENERFMETDIHIHVPEGATPKDGPSAGITMATAILSAFTNKTVNHDVAMTGEITLRGKVLPIGGLKEKILAAHRVGVKTVIIPTENKKDLEEIPETVRDDINIVLCDNVKRVFDTAING